MSSFHSFASFFFFNDTATTEIYTLSLHDALPISRDYLAAAFPELNAWERAGADASSAGMVDAGFENQHQRSEERFSRNAETDLVCRLLLEKKKKYTTVRNMLFSQFYSGADRLLNIHS